jgi:glycosyltransferase involved in cell wall biosynthesis
MYFAPSDVLIPRVDRQSIMRFCEAVAEVGWSVELVTLNLRVEFDEPTRTRNLFEVYGVEESFRVTTLPSWQRQSREGYRLLAGWRALAYLGLAARRSLFRRGDDVFVFYCKNYLLAWGLVALRKLLGSRALVLFEAHVPPSGRLARGVLKHVDGVIPVSRILGRELTEHLAIPPERILVAHHGTNMQLIERSRVSREEARKRLGLPLDRQLAVYTGKVNAEYREINYLIEAAEALPPTTEMVIVGGRDDQVALLRERVRANGASNVRFTGFVAPSEVFAYQSAADVLVSYYPGDLAINRYRASPGKLFEYMAAQRPIVTADYPALREVLSPEAAFFVERDRPALLAEGISKVLANQDLAEALADQAFEDVAEFTWDRRARRVRDFVEEMLAATEARDGRAPGH